jgi:hypothetical protein
MLCEALNDRHIAAGQPFQLPLYRIHHSDILDIVDYLEAYMDGDWLIVQKNPYNQRELMQIFGCEE